MGWLVLNIIKLKCWKDLTLYIMKGHPGYPGEKLTVTLEEQSIYPALNHVTGIKFYMQPGFLRVLNVMQYFQCSILAPEARFSKSWTPKHTWKNQIPKSIQHPVVPTVTLVVRFPKQLSTQYASSFENMAMNSSTKMETQLFGKIWFIGPELQLV